MGDTFTYSATYVEFLNFMGDSNRPSDERCHCLLLSIDNCVVAVYHKSTLNMKDGTVYFTRF